MFKKVLVCALICGIAVNSFFAATAEGVCYDWKWRISEDETTVFISGKADVIANSPFSLLVTAKSSDDIIYMMQGMTTGYGYFEVSVAKEGLVPERDYFIRIQSLMTDQAVSIPYYYATETQKVNSLAAISGAVTENDFAKILDSHKRILSLNLSEYENMDETDKNAVLMGLIQKEYTIVSDFQDDFYAMIKKIKKSYPVAFYVSPGGSDEAEGSFEFPFATINGAKRRIRRLIRRDDVSSDITVFIKGGMYREHPKLVFTEEDTLPNGCKVTYKNYADEDVIISGAAPVGGWELFKQNIYVADVGKGLEIDMIYENGESLTKARYPNKTADISAGYKRALGKVVRTTQEGEDIYSANQFYFYNGDVPQIADTRGLEVSIWPGNGEWMWHNFTADVKTVDYDTREITLVQNMAVYTLSTGCRYYIQGALELLDEPGEFHYDGAEGKLYYWPGDSDMNGKTVSVPYADNVVEFSGKSTRDTVANIELNGLILENSIVTPTLATQGGAKSSGDGIKLSNAENITIRNCIIHDVGGAGIHIVDKVNDCLFYGNEIYNLAGDGVVMDGVESEVQCANNRIVNNYIHDGSLLIGHSNGILNQHSGSENNYVEHNKICNFRRSAIRVRKSSYTNYFNSNDLSNVNTGSEDTGVIYVVSQNIGGTAVFRNNWIHDSQFAAGGGGAIYFDDYSHNSIAENNVIENIAGNSSSAVPFILKGDDIVIKNNYVVASPAAQAALVSRSQWSTCENIVMEKNIFYDYGNVFYRFPNWSGNRIASSDYNVFYNPKGVYTYYNTYIPLSWSSWRGSFDSHSITADPLFYAPGNGDYRLKYNSPAYQLGVDDINFQDIGLLSDFKYYDAADGIKNIFVRERGKSKNASHLTIFENEKVYLDVLSRTEKGFVDQDATVAYSIDDSQIAGVSPEGIIMGRSAGHAVVTVSVLKNGITSRTELDLFVNKQLISIKNIRFSDEFGDEKTDLSGESIVFEADFTGNTYPECRFTPIIAIENTDEKLLVSVTAAETFCLEDGEQAPFSQTIGLPHSGGNYRLKIFFWNTDTLRPVAMPIIF